VKVGDRVVIAAGRRTGELGIVTWSGIDGTCGCRSVIVRLRQGEWFGKQSEVRPAGEAYTVGERKPEHIAS
jgi:hypothetical protein